MLVPFTKLEGLGNDFVLIDIRNDPTAFDRIAPFTDAICKRRTGVGADGVLFLSRGVENPYLMRLVNADGTEAETCGNGLRCIALYIRDLGDLGDSYRIETLSRVNVIEWEGYRNGEPQFKVNMGKPVLQPSLIPTTLGGEKAVEEPLNTSFGEMRFTCVSMGNPHAVAFVESLDAVDFHRLGSEIERHPAFPNRINVELVKMISSNEAAARIWERGAKETPACGSGACAIAVAANLTGRGAAVMDICLPGGDLRIEWAGTGKPVYMTGTAKVSFTGTLKTESLG